MSKKVQLQVSPDVARAFKEFALLRGIEEEDLLREMIEEYVKGKYGIEDLEGLTAADIIRVMRFFSLLAMYMGSIRHMVGGFAGAFAGVPQIQQETEKVVEEQPPKEIIEVKEKVEVLASSIEQLKQTLLEKIVEREVVKEEKASMAELDEIRQEMTAMFLNWMRNMTKMIMAPMMRQQSKVAQTLKQ